MRVCSVVLLSATSSMQIRAFEVGTLLLLIVCASPMLYFVKAIQQCRDMIGIRRETNQLVVVVVCGIVGAMVMEVLPVHAVVFHPLLTLFLSIAIAMMAYVTVFIPRRDAEKDAAKKKVNEKVFDENEAKQWRLKKILETKEGFRLFANYLVTEFSVELSIYSIRMIHIFTRQCVVCLFLCVCVCVD